VILQDGQQSYHITIQNGDKILYDYFSVIKSRDEMIEKINILEYNMLNT